MSSLLAATLVAATVLVLSPPSSADRLRALAPSVTAQASARPRGPGPAMGRLGRVLPPRAVASGLGGLGVAVLIGGPMGFTGGIALGLVLHRWLGGLEPTAARRRRECLAAQLPLTMDLLAACLAAGRPPAESLAAVAAAVGEPVAEELRGVSAHLALGADPAAVWRGLLGHPQLAPLARTMLRAVETGAPVADGLSRLVDDSRRARRWEAEQQARSVGVRAAAPLAVCFLPAFVAVGLVPTIASAFGQLLR